MERFYGCHVSVSGGLVNAIKAANFLEINTIQIHPSPPQRWNSKPFARGVEDEFNSMRSASKVKKVFFHGIYLINLANPAPDKINLGRLSLIHDLELCSRMKADGVIFHVGSLKDEPNEDAGFARVAESIDWVLENSPQDSRLILEVAAGSGAVIGDRLEELQNIFGRVKDTERLGFGLDTQHMWASGYDLIGECEQIVEKIGTAFDFNKVWSIHLNDSMTQCGSKKDRHENLGKGLIGQESLAKFVNHKNLREIPIILETPAMKDLETAKVEVAVLKSMLGI